MEFDIGTWIYIAITIIAIVASVLGKKKKQPGQTETGEGSGSSGFFGKFEEQFEGFINETRDSVSNVREEFREETAEEEKLEERQQGTARQVNSYGYENATTKSAYSDYEGTYDPDIQDNLEIMEEEAVRSTDPEEIIQVIDLDESYHPDYFEIVKDFDLGTAVVYSTIINRLEY